MSIRDQVRSHASSLGGGDADLPLEQLARLKDKLIRHSRAEDAAMKRIRDLEMQLFTSKQEYEVSFKSVAIFNIVFMVMVLYFVLYY